jgi:hypothetical protein
MHAVGPRTAAVAIALTMLLCVVAIGGREPLRGTTEEPTTTRQEPEDAVVIAPPPQFPVPGALPPEVFVIDEGPGPLAWLPRAIAGLGLAAILVAGLMLLRNFRISGRRRRRRRGGRKAPGPAAAEPSSAGAQDDAEVARRAIEEAREALRDPEDPRAAVIAAYARMERVLAERELGRLAPEAPREYLARLLGEQGMPERSLATLTALFEEARFSRHPIPRSAPRRALSELERARVALAATDEHN